jgi:hypothetical protein
VQWYTSEGKCEEISRENMKQSPAGSVMENTVVKVTCSAAFSLIGHEDVTCLADGEWSSTGICEGRYY